VLIGASMLPVIATVLVFMLVRPRQEVERDERIR
jgi:hypothetical protein